MKRLPKLLLFSLIIVLIDQGTKVLVKSTMDLGEFRRVFGDWFKIQFIENPGAAFGLRASTFFGGMPEITGKLLLMVLSFAALAGVIYFLISLAEHHSSLPWFLAMIFGGAVGNMIDRCFYGVWFEPINYYDGGLFLGRVVDMFYFDLFDLPLPQFMGGGTYHLWPIFNVADAAITIGIIAILFFQGRYIRQHELKTASPAPALTPTDLSE